MIKSMTGFGKAELEMSDRTISVTIKSLNSKQLDMSARLPNMYRNYESDLRAEASKIVQRGKVDVSVDCVFNAGEVPATLNSNAIKTYCNQITAVAAEMGIELNVADLMQSVLRLPGVLLTDDSKNEEKERAALLTCFRSALQKFDEYRQKEGAALIVDIIKHVDNIENFLSQVPQYEKNRIDQIKLRIDASLNEYLSSTQIDKNRFEQEIIYYLEKLDITEEKVRLKQHCNYFRQTVDGDENPGRKIGFIAQEMGREINTLGSKANNVDIQKLVVQMKDELEKIKEQILNIL